MEIRRGTKILKAKILEKSFGKLIFALLSLLTLVDRVHPLPHVVRNFLAKN